MSKLKDFILPVATISGTIVGVGLFSLPYIAAKVGFFVMLFYFLAIGALITMIHLFFGELALETPDFKRLPGFAKFYFGSRGEKIALISVVIGSLGTLLAYLIVGGEFLSELLSPILGGNATIYTCLYFIAAASVILVGIKAVSKVELFALVSFFVILIFIFFKGLGQIKIGNLFPAADFSKIFLPYGPILFAVWGATMIPEAEEMLGENKKDLKKVILAATVIPIIIYLIFTFFVLGISGQQTTLSALPGLKNFLGSGIVSLALLFGVLTTFSAFIATGLTLKKVFWYDLRIKKELSWAITCFLPLTIFFLGVTNFIPLISFTGGIMLGVEGIMILLMYRKIRKNILVYPLMLVFLFGIIYEAINFIK